MKDIFCVFFWIIAKLRGDHSKWFLQRLFRRLNIYSILLGTDVLNDASKTYEFRH